MTRQIGHRIARLEAARTPWPADFWRAPDAWAALGVLLEAGGHAALRAAVELVDSGDDDALADLLAVAIPRTAHEIDLTRPRLRWAVEAITRKGPTWRAAGWWAEPETVIGAAAELACLDLLREHGPDGLEALAGQPGPVIDDARLARVIPAGLAGELKALENQL